MVLCKIVYAKLPKIFHNYFTPARDIKTYSVWIEMQTQVVDLMQIGSSEFPNNAMGFVHIRYGSFLPFVLTMRKANDNDQKHEHATELS